MVYDNLLGIPIENVKISQNTFNKFSQEDYTIFDQDKLSDNEYISFTKQWKSFLTVLCYILTEFQKIS